MHYKKKWKANKINCRLLRMIKSCYQVNETSWYTIKCTLQTHLCHNINVAGCAPGPEEAGMLPQVFSFHKQYILSPLWNTICQCLFFRALTVILKYSVSTVTAHYKDECYLIWQDYSEGCIYISMWKPVNCILLGQTAADPLIAEPIWMILCTISICIHCRMYKLRPAILVKSKDRL